MKINFNILVFLVIIVSCSSREDNTDIIKPQIYYISPVEGFEGTRIYINGNNFISDAKYEILLGEYSIEPISVTFNQLIFIIPSGISPGCYQIKLKVNDLTIIASQSITIKAKIIPIDDPEILSYNYSLGTQSIGPAYNFTSEDRLIETAKAILDMGSNILKITLSVTSYNITGRSYNSLTSLVRDDPSFSEVLNMPFIYYFFWARSNSNWADGYSDSERMEDSVQIGDLAVYLLTKYNNSGKRFYIGHWEGDWYLLPNYDVTYIPTDQRINGMIQWLRTRQNAVDEAKKITNHTNVEVFTYCEVNRVVDAMNGLRRVVNYVLPFTNVDYVSYSSYDSQNYDENRFKDVLNYIEGNLPPKPEIPGKRVFIGEMGKCAQDFGFNKAQHETVNRENIRKAISWGAPFVLYWEMYNNEIKDGVHRGFWLIDNTNSKWPLYDTYFHFYNDAKQWVLNYKKTYGKLPTHEEYLTWAFERLANP